eukprot:CAMPEP_0197621108 /NCGR_PEP_ID=MMETSP1338-20131121/1737_1 /TAXON_ID=43686 ORGANISM="Pelagodinium beii, Strain RCC1491" /NCGR_SAMPLE_ID=MMETSP1338 /ASSEMBLY_ACC=CAM_ASM_000754 /LENGTH=289 /DNA_ID=CAMNT_0043190449 /DNA_START=47 /DNA_END=916 /DNA_ORIENTATION=-
MATKKPMPWPSPPMSPHSPAASTCTPSTSLPTRPSTGSQSSQDEKGSASNRGTPVKAEQESLNAEPLTRSPTKGKLGQGMARKCMDLESTVTILRALAAWRLALEMTRRLEAEAQAIQLSSELALLEDVRVEHAQQRPGQRPGKAAGKGKDRQASQTSRSGWLYKGTSAVPEVKPVAVPVASMQEQMTLAAKLQSWKAAGRPNDTRTASATRPERARIDTSASRKCIQTSAHKQTPSMRPHRVGLYTARGAAEKGQQKIEKVAGTKAKVEATPERRCLDFDDGVLLGAQ